jgi:hypothetical protein
VCETQLSLQPPWRATQQPPKAALGYPPCAPAEAGRGAATRSNQQLRRCPCPIVGLCPTPSPAPPTRTTPMAARVHSLRRTTCAPSTGAEHTRRKRRYARNQFYIIAREKQSIHNRILYGRVGHAHLKPKYVWQNAWEVHMRNIKRARQCGHNQVPSAITREQKRWEYEGS